MGENSLEQSASKLSLNQFASSGRRSSLQSFQNLRAQLRSKFSKSPEPGSLKSSDESGRVPRSIQLEQLELEESALLADLEALVNDRPQPMELTPTTRKTSTVSVASSNPVFDLGKSASPTSPQARFNTQSPSSPMSPMSLQYLTTICAIMNSFAQTRKENRKLKTKLHCVQEMRQIEKLKAELIQANCTCSSISKTSMIASGEESTLHFKPEKVEQCKTSDALRNDPISLRTGREVTTSLRIATVAPLNREERDDGKQERPTPTLTVSSASPNLGTEVEDPQPEQASIATTTSNMTHSHRQRSALATHGSDSEDQSVFAEVELPTRRKSSTSQRNSLRSRSSAVSSIEGRTVNASDTSAPTSPLFPVDATLLYDCVSLDSKTGETVSRRGFWHRFGFPSRKASRSSAATSTSSITKMSQSVITPSSIETIPSIMSHSVIGPDIRESRRTSSTSDLNRSTYETGTLPRSAKQAILKKRKRKISESDSLASSETSGNPYKTINLPNFYVVRKKAGAGIVSTQPVAVDKPTTSFGHSRLNSKQGKRDAALPIGNQIDLSSIETSSESIANQVNNRFRGGWLRKAKLQKIDKKPQISSSETYFHRDHEPGFGRQDTVIYCEPESLLEKSSHSLSDGDVSNMVDKTSNEQDSSKSRSVTFLEPQLNSFLDTNSKDSVFSEESATDSKHVLNHVLKLQKRNSNLIQQLEEKTEQHDRISKQIMELESEVQSLKAKYSAPVYSPDLTWDSVVNSCFEPKFVAVNFLNQLDGNVRSLDDAVRKIKTDFYSVQQQTIENHSRELAVNAKCLDELERLQRSNIQLLHSQLNGTNLASMMKSHFESLPTYLSLYSFTVNLLKKLKTLRASLLDRTLSLSHADLELMQTQSSLLLAHAQLERSKLQLRVQNGGKFKCNWARNIRRVRSFHGEDLIYRTVKPDLQYFLPFKLQGSKFAGSTAKLDTVEETEFAELEFLKLFGPYAEFGPAGQSYTPLFRPLDPGSPRSQGASRKGSQQDSGVDRSRPEPIYESIPLKSVPGSRKEDQKPAPIRVRAARPTRLETPRPLSSGFNEKSPLKSGIVGPNSGIARKTSRGRLAKNFSVDKEPEPDDAALFRDKAPSPLRLGNNGQVKSLAAAFDTSNPSSAPNTPLAKGAPHLLNSTLIPSSPVLQRRTSGGAENKRYGTAVRLQPVSRVSRPLKMPEPDPGARPSVLPRNQSAGKPEVQHRSNAGHFGFGGAKPNRNSVPARQSASPMYESLTSMAADGATGFDKIQAVSPTEKTPSGSTWSISKLGGSLRKSLGSKQDKGSQLQKPTRVSKVSVTRKRSKEKSATVAVTPVAGTSNLPVRTGSETRDNSSLKYGASRSNFMNRFKGSTYFAKK